MAIFEGAGVALVTPFKENGTVNYEVLESLIEEQWEQQASPRQHLRRSTFR